MGNRLQLLRPLLCCPSCHGELADGEATLQCVSCYRSYPIVRGKPILLIAEHHDPAAYAMSWDDAGPVSAHPYGPRSQQIIDRHRDGWVLDLGSGGKLSSLPNVVQMDITPYSCVDVVASAHSLPFRDSCFDAIISQAVFEHLRWPDQAVAEIRRVAKAGAQIKIDTAFLQPEHAYPDHYFNATQAGLLHWFRDFEIEWVGVEDYQHPVYTIGWILSWYLEGLASNDAARLRDVSVGRLVEVFSAGGSADPELWAALLRLPAEMERKLACGVSLLARNSPAGESACWKDSERQRDGTMLAQRLLMERLRDENARLQEDILVLRQLIQVREAAQSSPWLVGWLMRLYSVLRRIKRRLIR